MADNLKIIKKINIGTSVAPNDYEIGAKYDASNNEIELTYAKLSSDGRVPASLLPSYVDDVLEYDSLSSFPAEGETGKIYIAKDTNKTYRWSGSIYVVVSETLAIGETSSTAYAGDKGKANATAIAALQTKVGDTPVATQIIDAIANYYTKDQIDTYEFITIDDIDEICEGSIQPASEVKF